MRTVKRPSSDPKYGSEIFMPKQGFIFSREPMESKQELPETLPCEMSVLDTKVAHPEKRGDSTVQPRKHGSTCHWLPKCIMLQRTPGRQVFLNNFTGVSDPMCRNCNRYRLLRWQREHIIAIHGAQALATSTRKKNVDKLRESSGGAPHQLGGIDP